MYLSRRQKIWMENFKEHQIEGVEWMWKRISARKGVVLSDEMGTGKTMQALEIAKRVWSQIGKSILIVAPCTLLQNWKKEMDKMGFSIPARVVRSSDAGAENVLRGADGNYIVILNYELLQRKKGQILQSFFDLVIFDEAQRIKNRETMISKVSRLIDARSKMCITGTPIQNSLSELWSITETVRPGYFGDYQRFKSEIEEPLKKSTLKNSTELEKQKGASIKEHINMLLSEIVIRRTKEDLAGFSENIPEGGLAIPRRKEHTIYCPLTREQQSVYKRVLRNDLTRATVMGKRAPLKSIAHLKSICSHPIMADSELTRWSDSGKMQVIHRLLFMWRHTNRKILLFSQYKETLRILQSITGRNTYRIDGDSPIRKREEVFNTFGSKEGLEVLLMSMKVGGVGINLQKSDTVILFDIDWNPFNEEQAKGRAHRMGQKKEVEIYRLICRGTIEESIEIVQEVKKTISKGVLDGIKSKQVFDKVDLCRLFHYSHDPLDITDLDTLASPEYK
ncbi:DNA excision repair protein ERCC-6 [Nematocida parisii]|nr:DNA excision repair protein ERCC-6 [Nematocida parisii]KAI5152963.1 DNA excision repair protein ERCC-6 [Nematocida parisii]